MTDISDAYGDTGYYDGSYSTAVDTAVDTGTTTDHGTSVDYTADSYDASQASWDAWGASTQADTYANEAWYAGDYETSAAWTEAGNAYEADSYTAESASYDAYNASSDAYADESAAWDASYSTTDSTDYSADDSY